MPLPDSGLVYVRSPKAGCSTIRSWLDRIRTGELDARLSIAFDHRPYVVRRVEEIYAVDMELYGY